jgi:hypothetical protein
VKISDTGPGRVLVSVGVEVRVGVSVIDGVIDGVNEGVNEGGCVNVDDGDVVIVDVGMDVWVYVGARVIAAKATDVEPVVIVGLWAAAGMTEKARINTMRMAKTGDIFFIVFRRLSNAPPYFQCLLNE